MRLQYLKSVDLFCSYPNLGSSDSESSSTDPKWWCRSTTCSSQEQLQLSARLTSLNIDLIGRMYLYENLSPFHTPWTSIVIG